MPYYDTTNIDASMKEKYPIFIVIAYFLLKEFNLNDLELYLQLYVVQTTINLNRAKLLNQKSLVKLRKYQLRFANSNFFSKTKELKLFATKVIDLQKISPIYAKENQATVFSHTLLHSKRNNYGLVILEHLYRTEIASAVNRSYMTNHSKSQVLSTLLTHNNLLGTLYVEIQNDYTDIKQELKNIEQSQLLNLASFIKIKAQNAFINKLNIAYLPTRCFVQAVFDEVINSYQTGQIRPALGNPNIFVGYQINAILQRIQRDYEAVVNININVAPVHGLNNSQSTHTASVHETSSESALKLYARYHDNINTDEKLGDVLTRFHSWINALPLSSTENNFNLRLTAARRAYSRLSNPNYTYKDPVSNVSTRLLLGLTYLAINDTEQSIGSLQDAGLALIDGMYQIQREYNINSQGRDTCGDDRCCCSPGTFNKIIESICSIHKDVIISFVTPTTAGLKLQCVVKQEALRYLTDLKNISQTKYKKICNDIISATNNEIIAAIYSRVADVMHEEFGRYLYKDGGKENLAFIALINTAEFVDLSKLPDIIAEQAKIEGITLLEMAQTTFENQQINNDVLLEANTESFSEPSHSIRSPMSTHGMFAA